MKGPSDDELAMMDKIFMVWIAPFLRAGDDPDGAKLAMAWVNYKMKKMEERLVG